MQRPFLQVRTRFTFLLVICVLQLLSNATGHASASVIENPYNRRFADLRVEFAKSESPRQVILLSEAVRLRDFVDCAQDVREWLISVSEDTNLNPLVRDEAVSRLASVLASEGDFHGAELYIEALGFVRDWSVAGPFPKQEGGRDLVARGYRKDDIFPDGHGGNRGWRHIAKLGPSPAIKLSNFFPAGEEVVAYAETSIFSAIERDVALRFSSEPPLTLLVNGRQIYSSDRERSFAFDQSAISVHLHSGWNPLLAKFVLAGGPARFAVRVTSLQGGGVPIVSSAIRDHEPTALAAEPVLDAPSDLVEMARSLLQRSPNDAERLADLGNIEREHAVATDLEHLQSAARLQPTASRWLDVARSCHEASCRFEAFSAALRSDPKNVESLVGLADYYLSRNQPDHARDALLEALSASPGHFVVRDRLAELYLATGLTAAAAKESASLLHDFPAPLWLSHSIGARYTDIGLIEDAIPLLRRSLSGNLNRDSDRELLARIYRRRHDGESLDGLLRQAGAVDPNESSVMSQLADLQLGNGNQAGAKATMEAALAINPDDEALRQQSADIFSRAGDKASAEKQLALALQLKPSLENVRRRLQRSSRNRVDEDASFLEDPVTAIMAAKCASVQAGTNVTGISDVRIERMYDNGLSSTRSQQIFCMASEQGARDFATRVIQYSPATQELKINHARVHKTDGRVLDATEAGETRVADTSVSMYYDVRSRALNFPEVQKGDVVELDYTIAPTVSSNPYGDYFATLVSFRALMPEKLQRYVLVAPSRRKLNIVEHAMPHAALEETRTDQHIYRWEEREIPALPNEPRGPALTESAPYVHVSTFGSWNDMGRWYAQLISPQFELDSTLRDVAARVTAGHKTEIEKINAIYQFVLRNTHYVALEFGIYSYKPYPVTQVYARRFGDCKDKASLMIALLRQAGIEADITLVRTRRLGDIDDRAVSIALFNHAIVYVPKWDLWLDGTAEYAGSRELPLDDQGAMALVVGLNGNASLRRIPATSAEDNYTHRTVRARVQKDGNIEFTGTAYTRGEDAPGLRRDFEVTERQRDLFRNSLAEVFPTVRLDDVHVDGATDLEHDVSVEFRGVLDAFTGRRVLSLNTSWMPRSYVQPLAQLESRTQDLLLPTAWTTEEDLHFQLPGGAALISVPADKSLVTPFGFARIQYQRHGRELIISTSVQFKKPRITPAEYSGFREFCREIESAFRAEVKVTLPTS